MNSKIVGQAAIEKTFIWFVMVKGIGTWHQDFLHCQEGQISQHI